MRELLTIAACLAAMAVWLLLERRNLARDAGRIALRIVVTGTRGKSTVTRLIAGSLRAAGRPVLAKTTGSRPMVILPDGSEQEIVRRGPATILEQKRVLARAAELGARAVVSELMAVRPDVLAVESRRLFRPHLVVITNVRIDHREEQGRTKPEIAAALASAIAPGSKVFAPDTESCREFERECARVGAELVRVPLARTAASAADRDSAAGVARAFPEDEALVLAVAQSLGIEPGTARRGMAAAAPDLGSFGVWTAELGTPPAPWLLASAFAANDPESTGRALERLRGLRDASGRELVGLLCLRRDRGDRSVQWSEALESGFFRGFSSLYIAGAQVRAGRWRRPRPAGPSVRPLAGRSAESIMGEIVRGHPAGAVLVGLGNMGGLGRPLVEHWAAIGRPRAL